MSKIFMMLLILIPAFNFTLCQENSALLVIDVQEEFTSSLDSINASDFLKKINSTIDLHRQGKVIFIQANIRMLSVSLKGIKVEQAENLDLDHRLNINTADKVWMKNEASAFSIDSLSTYLDSLGVKDLFICGMYGDECVKATALDGISRGYNVELIWNAILFKKEKNRRKLRARI